MSKVKEEEKNKLQVHANGEEYSVYTITQPDGINDETVDVEYKLFHTIVNRRLDGETFSEYKNRQVYINKFKKERRNKKSLLFQTTIHTIDKRPIANIGNINRSIFFY